MGKIGYVGSLLREVVQFARENKAYWIVPFVLVLGLLVLLVVTSQTAAPNHTQAARWSGRAVQYRATWDRRISPTSTTPSPNDSGAQLA